MLQPSKAMKTLLPTRKYCVVHQSKRYCQTWNHLSDITKIVAPGTISFKLSDGSSGLPIILYKSIPRDSVKQWECFMFHFLCIFSVFFLCIFSAIFSVFQQCIFSVKLTLKNKEHLNKHINKQTKNK